MKKRILSGLLALFMLISLIPVTVLTAETEGSGTAGAETIANWNELYVKDGLVALFNALDADSATVDLAAGKWYGYKVENGALVRDENLVVTVNGGAYDAESNPTGWVKGANGGISYADPANNAPSNGIVLDKTLLSDTTFTVESLLSYSLRDIPMTQKDYAATKATDAGEDGLYVWTYSGVQTIRYTHKPVKIRVNGEAGTTFSYNVVAGSDTTGTQTATIGADGTYTIDTTYYTTGGSLDITVSLPEGVTAGTLTTDVYSEKAEASAPLAFSFGALYALVWTNLQGTNTWSNGKGMIRWSYANRAWTQGGSDANAAWREDDDKNFKAQRDRLSVMEVSMTKSDANERTYKVTYAGQTLLEKADDGTNVKTGNDFTLLVGLPGTVYALRVYDRLLTTAEKNRNKAVDILQKVGYDLAAFNAKNASERELLLVKAMSLDVETATLADFAPLDREPTGFETFYVQDGLVGLYDAFNTDHVDLATGVWTASHGLGDATLLGAAKSDSAVYGWFKGENGGIGYRMTVDEYTAHKNEYGINLPTEYMEFADYTVEIAAKYAGITNEDGTRYSADGVYLNNFNRSPFRLGLLNSLSFVLERSNKASNESMANRWFFSYYAQGQHSQSAANSSKFRSVGNDTVFQSVGPDTAINVTFTKVTGATEDTALTYGIYYNCVDKVKKVLTQADIDEVTETAGGVYQETATPFSLFNGYPGTVYSIRIYDRALTAAEMQQNHAVDIAAFVGFDFAKLETLSETDKNTFFTILSGKDFTATLAEVDGIYDNLKAIAEAIAAARKMTAYDLLYVGADGGTTANGGSLTVLLSAFGKDPVSVDLENKIWYSKVGTIDATLNGTLWKRMPNGGVGYNFDTYGDSPNMTLPISALPDGEYSIEVVASVRGTVDQSTGALKASGQYGFSPSHATFSFGPLHEWLYSGIYNGGYNDYTGNKFLTCYQDGLPIWYETGYKWAHVKTYTKDGAPDMRVLSVTTTLTFVDDTSVYTFHKEGAKSQTLTKIRDVAITTVEKNATQSFVFFRGTETEAYAVRVYDAPLTESEIRQNRAVDLLAFTGFDVAKLDVLKGSYKNLFFDSVNAKDFTATLAEVEAVYDTTVQLQEEALAAKVKTAYDALYIGADGGTTANGGSLTLLLSAFGEDASVMHKGENIWLDKVGDNDAVLKGTWSRMAGGGLGYDIKAKADGTYMELPLSALPTGSYTVEMVASVRGWTVDAAGEEVMPATGKFGFAAGTYAAFSFGPMQPFLYTGIGCTAESIGASGWTDNYAYTGNRLLTMYRDHWTGWEAPWDQKTVKTYMISNTQPDIRMLSNTIVLTKGETTSSYDFYKEGAFLQNVTWNTIEINESHAFYLFRSVGSTVLSVRVYDAPLTEAEITYNRFIDLAAYAEADVTEFAKLSANARANVAERCKTLAYSKDKTPLENAIAAETAKQETAKQAALTYEGLAARLRGADEADLYAGIRSLYSLNEEAIALLEEYYDVAYGAITGIAAFGGETFYTSADQLRVTGNKADGFTAVGDCSACVTVYGAAGATGLYLVDVLGNGTYQRGFAYTSVLGSAAVDSKEYYEVGMVYAGFLALMDKNTGEVVEMIYIPASGTEFAVDGAPTSVYQVASYFIQDERYADNAILNKVVTACN